MSWLMAENCIKFRPRAARLAAWLGAIFEFHHHTVTFNYLVIFPGRLKIEYSIVIGIDFTVVNVHARLDEILMKAMIVREFFVIRETFRIKSSGDRWKRRRWSQKFLSKF